MNSKVIAGVVAVLVVTGLGWYFYSKSTSNQPAMQMSMKELMASRKTQKCTFSEPQSNTSGTMYMADGKMRTDFTSQNQGQTIAGHMITDGTDVHTWMDGMAQGMKSSFTATNTDNANAQQGVDPNLKTDYQCEKWSKDESLFALPGGITFMDVSAMMQGSVKTAVPEPGATSKSAQCNACDMAPEPQRSQCRQALSCR